MDIRVFCPEFQLLVLLKCWLVLCTPFILYQNKERAGKLLLEGIIILRLKKKNGFKTLVLSDPKDIAMSTKAVWSAY
jgi:hypothetical protein